MALFAISTLILGAISGQNPDLKPPLPGIDFSDDRGTLYVSAKAISQEIGFDYLETKRNVKINYVPVAHVRTLFDGTKLIPIHDLDQFGAKSTWDQATLTAGIQYKGNTYQVHRGDKKAEVSIRSQTLRAYQGGLLVLQTHVSTGRRGHGTPSGDFAAARKERIHYSSIYDDSPMPYAVQVHGNIFIHGFTSVPRRPASHGCVRVPLTGKNPARYFYSWVEIGTPVTISYNWPEDQAKG
ncbi:MAG TPA: L,D-transpeptidase family protein [Fimbriimonadaceae bacterium]|jgi:hypothetical protein